MQIKIVSPLDIPEWDERILSFKEYSFFHSRSWAEVLISAYRYHPRYFTLWRGDELRAVIPVFEVASTLFGRKGVSLPFTDHCRPLVSEPEDFQRLFEGIVKSGKERGWQKIEFRGGRNFMPDDPESAVFNLHTLQLVPDEKAMLANLRNSTRRNIKKARQKKITIEIATDFSAIQTFYRLNCITRRHHGVPPQPFHFFRCIQEHVLSKNKGMIVLADYEGQAIAGAVFFHFGRKAMYKYGASRRDSLGIRPNNLVMWEAIRWYVQNGFSAFDMGRSEPDNNGLNQFKNGWGASVENIFYYTFDVPKMKFSWENEKLTSGAGRIFRKMPMPVLRIVGELAYRHMG